ncbi:lipopolysaccharide biosynthesis protein [Pseudomonas saudiphocaensis]|uniref:Polysaccharide biosynthesis protein n=1 Tax=Pseudomonas saudiphocaensis TaxID=1499686 RepID=A0A078LWF4_9PSED|nr:oligosaccharide flippase family protein [Pseudomonas saudiphocaensis]CDZ94627.1 polysaccharide biosynthesis protein [Pseudomonas saudiphocaensis]
MAKFILGKFDKASEVLKNMSVLALGSFVGKVASVVLVPIITRIYGPESLGVLTVYLATLMVITPFASFRYSIALPLIRSDSLAINLATLAACCTLLAAVIVFCFLFFVFKILKIPGSDSVFVDSWWLLLLSFLLLGFYELFTGWAIRKKEFKLISYSSALPTILGDSAKVLLGLLGASHMGLLAGQLLKHALSALYLAKLFFGAWNKHKVSITFRRLVFLSRRFSDYPIFRLPSQFVLLLSMQLPIFFCASRYGADVAGQLGLALMTLALPVALFGQTTSQAYYAEIAKLGATRLAEIREITKSLIVRLFILSLFPFFTLLFGGPYLFKIVYGDEWRLAGVAGSALSICIVFQFITTPIMRIFDLLDKQRLYLCLNFVRLVGVAFVFLFSWYQSLSFVSTMWVYSFCMSSYYFLIAFILWTLIRFNQGVAQ